MSSVAYFAIRDDDLPGSGTQQDPYNGSTDARLDDILENVITSDMTLIFGPGVFQTKGSGGATLGWNINDRTRIIGSGMKATVLQLVGATLPPNTTSARVAIIRSIANVTDIEISDLTLDVNMARQPKLTGQSNAALCGQGTLIFGNNVTVRRVRVINWGTYTDELECFPLFVEGASNQTSTSGQVVIADCIVEHPALSQARESTMVNVHSHIANLSILSISRNNYANASYVAGSPELAHRRGGHRLRKLGDDRDDEMAPSPARGR